MDWNYKTVRQTKSCLGLNGQSSKWPRGKVIGGSSVLNYMLYVRGCHNDYDEWAALGCEGWSWNDVFPYFLKSEDNQDPDIRDNGWHGKGKVNLYKRIICQRAFYGFSNDGSLEFHRYRRIFECTTFAIQNCSRRVIC